MLYDKTHNFHNDDDNDDFDNDDYDDDDDVDVTITDISKSNCNLPVAQSHLFLEETDTCS